MNVEMPTTIDRKTNFRKLRTQQENNQRPGISRLHSILKKLKKKLVLINSMKFCISHFSNTSIVNKG